MPSPVLGIACMNLFYELEGIIYIIINHYSKVNFVSSIAVVISSFLYVICLVGKKLAIRHSINIQVVVLNLI